MGVRLVRYNRPISGNTDNNPAWTYDHNELINRDLLNQHPIYAITGLQEALNLLEDNITVLFNLTNQQNTQVWNKINDIVSDLDSLDKRLTDAEAAIKHLQSMKYIDSNSVKFDYKPDIPSLQADVRIYEPPTGQQNTNILACLANGLYVPSTFHKDSLTVVWDVKTNNPGGASNIDATANVNLSKDSTNGLSVKQDGLYSELFRISKKGHNAIVKEDDGYWVEQFRISNRADNSLQKLSDGTLYVRDYRNIRIVSQQNHGFIVGDFIYYRHDIAYQKALGIDSYDANIVGMVTKIIDNDNFEYQWAGFFSTDLFSSANGYTQGMPIYISDVDAGKAVQEQPDISKTVGYPVENAGIIIAIERGIQYNQEATIGDFKTSANTYNVRSDGFIRVIEGVDYKQTIVKKLIDAMSQDFKDSYMIIDDTKGIIQFKNTQELYESNDVKNGLSLFIKAF